ncbi:nickel/cobalt transporter [Erwinia sp. 198]|uniref:nickel/cobalt transporter n=1 Tax=Erwinia sp. 198 TaxID=2022746 RepID=UPI000F672DE4|nr:nickel/cobalt transporter [Erwinia sp. 198]RRZ90955.1 nickel/cobalt transporter [Erwinia sp. 198]
MSVMPVAQRARSRWLQAWPLYLLLLIFIAAGAAAWRYWPHILLQSVVWQRNLHVEMTALLQQVASRPHQVGLTLVGFSVIYGILHALGPGHGKVVIATFLATHPTKMKTSIRLTLAAALLQGGVAVALVTSVLVALQLSSRQLHVGSYWLEKGSYLLVVGLGLWLCWRAGGRIVRLLKKPRLAVRRMVPVEQGHQHGPHCGCGHQHVPDSGMLDRAVSGKTKALVVLSMGLRPCSGAIMMLLFSKVIGVYAWGVVSALAMAVGTAVTVTAMAVLVQVSRALALKLSRRENAQGDGAFIRATLSLAGGLLLLATGVMLWLSAQPALSGGIRPLF